MYKHGRRRLELRRRTYELLEHGPGSDRASLIIDRFLVLLIITNLAVVILESVPSLLASYRFEFTIVELFSLVVFSVEYFLRIWAAPEHAPHPKLSGEHVPANLRKIIASRLIEPCAARVPSNDGLRADNRQGRDADRAGLAGVRRQRIK